MRPRIEPSNDLALSSPFRSWLDCTTNTSGYDFRKGQLLSHTQWWPARHPILLRVPLSRVFWCRSLERGRATDARTGVAGPMKGPALIAGANLLSPGVMYVEPDSEAKYAVLGEGNVSCGLLRAHAVAQGRYHEGLGQFR